MISNLMKNNIIYFLNNQQEEDYILNVNCIKNIFTNQDKANSFMQSLEEKSGRELSMMTINSCGGFNTSSISYKESEYNIDTLIIKVEDNDYYLKIIKRLKT